MRSHTATLHISRAAAVNNDLQLMTRVPYEFGQAGSRKIGDEVSSVLTTYAATADGYDLFSSDHANLGSAGAPGTTEIEELFSLMGAQQNSAGDYLNYKPRFILSGPGYASILAQLRAAMNAGNDDGLSDGTIVTLIDSRLSGTTKWYALADSIFRPIILATLDGQAAPTFERVSGPISRDGEFYRSRIDFVVVPGNWKAMAYNPGA